MNTNLKTYLAESDAIDFNHPSVSEKAEELAAGSGSIIETEKRCFEFVRDGIYHCIDYDMNPVTYRASEVLRHRTGFCYAKSHLLAALLRANGIPAGLCYQRITLDKPGEGLCLHGLAAVYLPEYGWYRVDPRGNKDGVDAQFNPPHEQLAFKIIYPGEHTFPEIWPEPVPPVVKLLTGYTDYREALKNLPDIEVYETSVMIIK